MPVRKFRDVSEMEDNTWREPGDPANHGENPEGRCAREKYQCQECHAADQVDRSKKVLTLQSVGDRPDY